MNVATACRDIKELKPLAQQACNLFLSECKKAGLDIFITETYRSQDRQEYLYTQGRNRPGKIITWTKKSNHTGRMAWDIACNKPSLYDKDTLKKAGQIGMSLNIGWGGVWKTPDMPHFEITDQWKAPAGHEVELIKVEKKVETLFNPESPTLKQSVEYVLYRMELEGDLTTKWRFKLQDGTLTESEAIGLLFVAVERGFIHNKYSNK